MNRTHCSRAMTLLSVAFVVGFLAVEIAEARRGGGGRGMMRGGPAASGSFQRARARPQRGNYGTRNRGYGRDFSHAGQPKLRYNEGGRDRQDRYDQRQQNRDERRDNRQDRFDRRQEQIDERQDFRKEVYKDRKEYYNDREEWYENRWRRGLYISVGSWNTMGCTYDTVIIDGIRYYECNGVRYERVYRGGEVVYIVAP